MQNLTTKEINAIEAQLTALIPQLGVSLAAGIGNDGHLERAIEYGAMELEDALGNVEGERARDRDERNLNYWPADDVAQARDVLHWAWRALGLTVREPRSLVEWRREELRTALVASVGLAQAAE